MRPVLLFDIETVPDGYMAGKVLGHTDLTNEEALAQLFPPKKDGEKFGFPKPLYHQVVEVAVCAVGQDGEVRSLRHLSRPVNGEADLLRDFWLGFKSHQGDRIVTFNGRRFDVPVLVQRALYNGVSPAPIFTGNYRMRFQDGHIDLMEILSDYGASTPLSQNEAAVMLGVPGKVGVDGGDVAALWSEGKVEDIAAYCTCDVATLTLCYARLGLHTGWCSEEESQKIEQGVREAMSSGKHPLFSAFLDAWTVK